MRHRKRGRQLGRKTKHRRALFRNLVTALFEHERIETTEAKAKEIRSLADRMVTCGKQGDLSARRRAAAFLMNPKVVQKLFSDIAPRFTERNGGYTRLIKTRIREGDGAKMAAIELVVQPETEKPAISEEKGEKEEKKKAS